MAFKHTNSIGNTYHLHSTVSPRSKQKLYHFSKQEKATGQEHALPAGYTVGENPVSKLPVLKKIQG